MGANEKKDIPPYFRVYTKYCGSVKLLTSEQAGAVFKHICGFVEQEEDLPPLEEPLLAMLAELVEKDIEAGFKSYRAKCENGKKGGAPKGNKNAAKKKENSAGSTTTDSDDSDSAIDESDSEEDEDSEENITPMPDLTILSSNLPIDKFSERIAGALYLYILLEAEKTNFEIDKYFTKEQISELATCYSIREGENYGYYPLKNKYGGYESLKDFTLAEGATNVCNTAREQARDEANQRETDFLSTVEDYKQRALKMLEFPDVEIYRFEIFCGAVINAFYSEKELKKFFSPSDIERIHAEREARNNLNST